jgi:hypothetical protein
MARGGETGVETVYLETTFISYLVARPSRDLLVAAHQHATEEWWATRRGEFECCVSQVVIDEASIGDPRVGYRMPTICTPEELMGV